MNHQTRVYDSILELLPDADNPTPLVRLHRVVPFQVTPGCTRSSNGTTRSGP